MLISGEGSHLSGGSEDRAPAAMARAITVHVDTMKVILIVIFRLILTLKIFAGDVLRLRTGVDGGSIHRNLLRPTLNCVQRALEPCDFGFQQVEPKRQELQNTELGTLGSS